MLRLFCVLTLLFAISSAIEHHKRAEANQWFSHLEHISPPPPHDHVAHAHNYMCCHTLSFQETLDGQWAGRTTVPFDHWLTTGKVRLGITYNVDEPVERALEISDAGLVLDGSKHSEVYLRIQCSYPCCIEAISLLRPESDPYTPVVSAASTEWSGQREEDANSLIPHTKSRYGRGIPSEHVFVTPRVDQDERRQELDVCQSSGEGIYVRVNLAQRREYAIAELDLCFLDADLGHEDVNSWCHESEAVWSIIQDDGLD